MTFSVRIAVRGYELDGQGHVNNAVYFQYGDHARWECLRAAGISVDDLWDHGIGPVTLENTIRYHRELRAGDEVDVTCAFEWGEGKTFRVRQEFRKPDGELAAEMTGVGGLMDLEVRRLLDDPKTRWRALARTPAVLGL
ncbi:acyl-CoA thioesterase [Nonomuraea sp. KC401]|uniref:acyl-CoA thioesterase n=1 Tax=unclassified Nonomuraea TaxID=2593643 RepID=UPI0010FD16E9|nr:MULTISPECIES: acyl-CoA thioesterase [unclassified Nonomuraea]NBE99365.1 thioesterase [Nonomuraea sp. K271]TLF60927.1 acyl-CoA thioesterase [Nonomuraea sp. KC401]